MFSPRHVQLLGWAVKAVVLQAKAGGYDSVLAAALGFRGIPTAVYTSLLSTVQAALPRTLHKYMALRGRLLGARSSAGEAFQLRPWDVRARGGRGRPMCSPGSRAVGKGWECVGGFEPARGVPALCAAI